MRIPAWLFIIGVILLMALTAILSLVAFSVARQVAVDIGNSTGPQGLNVSALPTPTRVPVQTLSTRVASVSGAGDGAVGIRRGHVVAKGSRVEWQGT